MNPVKVPPDFGVRTNYPTCHKTSANNKKDSHFRVGGAIGSQLQANKCPKKASSLHKDCVAGSLMLRITKQASAYMENIWAWVADHDMDIKSQDQVDVYVARGILVESQGPTWMYGTASEHSVLYQYQISGAKDLVMGMIQTESPYFQPSPPMPEPFTLGRFPNDPVDVDCETCTSSWAVRIVDSESISILGAGMLLIHLQTTSKSSTDIFALSFQESTVGSGHTPRTA